MWSLLLSSVILGLGLQVGAWNSCPSLGREMRLYPSRKGWLEAERQCQMDGGHLATIRTEEDRLCAVHAIEQSNQCSTHSCGRIWTGLNSLNDQDSWHWVGADNAGQEDTPGQGIWATGEPDNPGSQQCANWNPEFGVGDDYCGIAEMFICQRTKTNNAFICQGQQWTYHPLGFDHAYAQAVCAQWQGTLAPPDRNCLSDFFDRSFMSSASEMTTWIGCLYDTPGVTFACTVMAQPDYSLNVTDVNVATHPKPFICAGRIGDISTLPGRTPPPAVFSGFSTTPSRSTAGPATTVRSTMISDSNEQPQLSGGGVGNAGIVVACGFIGATIAFVVVGVIIYYRKKQRKRAQGPVRKMEDNAIYERGPGPLQRQSSVKTTKRNHLTLTLQVSKERTTTHTELSGPASEYMSVPYATSPLSCVVAQQRDDDSQPYGVRKIGIPPPGNERPKLDMPHEYAEPLSCNPAYKAPTFVPQGQLNEYSYDVPSEA
eukprot:scpid56470/ scgid32172/ CD209 antigen-like protein 2